jgi:hypothetical protein
VKIPLKNLIEMSPTIPLSQSMAYREAHHTMRHLVMSEKEHLHKAIMEMLKQGKADTKISICTMRN